MRITFVSSLLFASALASPVLAQEVSKCSGIVMNSVQSGYPFQDFGFDGSPNAPVSQNMVAASCKHFTLDWWSSTGIAGGDYGRRGNMDEHDFELTYANSAKTPIGTVEYSLYGAYFLLDLGKGLAKTSDDYAQFYAEAAKPIIVGSWKVTPFGRYIRTVPIGFEKGVTSIRLGSRLDGQLTTDLSLHAEAAHTINHGAAPYQQVWRGEIDLSSPLTKTFTLTGGLKITQHVGVTPLIKGVYSF